MKKIVCLYLCLFVFSPAHAVLIGTNSGGELIEIDEVNGIATQFGSLGAEALGAAYNPLTDTYYARSFNNLYTFDLLGNVSLVGASGSSITGLTFNSTYSSLFSISQGNGDFYSIDIATGAASLIGNTGLNFALGLSTDSSGNVYTGTGSGDIYSIDLISATSTFVTNVGADLTSIAFDQNDVLYGVTLTGDILRTDLLGSPSNIGGNLGFIDIRGLTFNNPATSVPGPTSLALLGLGLAGLGFSRKKKTV